MKRKTKCSATGKEGDGVAALTPSISIVYDFRNEAITADGEQTGAPGTISVKVYEHKRRRRKMISTGVRVLPSEWDDRLKCVVGRDDAFVLNRMIEAQVTRCRDSIVAAVEEKDGETPTVKQMKVDRAGSSWLDYLKKAIDENVNLNSQTRKHHETMYRVFAEWGKIRRFDQLTKANLREYIVELSRRKVMKNVAGRMVEVQIAQPTVHGHWKKLRSYINKAIIDGYVSASVLRGFKVERGKAKIREFLNDEEIERWCSVELTKEYLKAARDRFIVQMSCGMAYKDLMTFDWSNHTTINGQTVLVGQRAKTGEEYFTVMLPRGVEVMERLGWSLAPISNTDYNVYLDLVAKCAGIEKHVTSHVARHTFACYCLRRGVNIVAVQRTLGHSKVETTQIYARLAGMDVVNAFKDLK